MPQKKPFIPWEKREPLGKALKLRMQQVGFGDNKMALGVKADVYATTVTILLNGEGGGFEGLQAIVRVLNRNPLDPEDKPFSLAKGHIVDSVIDWEKSQGASVRKNMPVTLKCLEDEADAIAEKMRAHAVRLGKKTEARRQRLGVSQEELGRNVTYTRGEKTITGVTKQAISNIENGDFNPDGEGIFPEVVLALGYPEGTERSLLHDKPVTPDWVTALQGQSQGTGGHQQRVKKTPPKRGR